MIPSRYEQRPHGQQQQNDSLALSMPLKGLLIMYPPAPPNTRVRCSWDSCTRACSIDCLSSHRPRSKLWLTSSIGHVTSAVARIHAIVLLFPPFIRPFPPPAHLRCWQIFFENTFHLGTGVMFSEFMLYNLEMESDERVVDIKVR